MPLVPNMIAGPAGRIAAAAQNALEVARFGGLETDEQPAPYEVVAERPVYRLRRYFADRPADGPPIVLVPPMMLAADVYDVSPTASGVSTLHELGIDPWVVDFGSPDQEEGGLDRDLTDHVLAVSDAVDRVAKITGRDVHLSGYSQGGMFCYQAAAYRRGERLASLVTFGSPVDLTSALPLGIPEAVATRGAGFLAELLGGQALPAWASRTGFRLLDPVKSLRQRIDFIRQLHDREALLPRERQRRFLAADGWVAWPGPALADVLRQFVAINRMLSGGFVIEDRLVTLADIDCPVLCFVGTVDEIAPPKAVRAIVPAAPRAEVYERPLRAGHFGLVVGSAARETTWPTVAGWMRWRDGDGELPDEVEPMTERGADGDGAAAGLGARLGYGVELWAGVTFGLAKTVTEGASRTLWTLRQLSGEAAGQLPRLARLDRLTPRTRISLGLLLDESASNAPQDVNFLFEDRAHTHAAVKDRIDAVVKGLLSLGVRQGEHVGVLMATRPSALAVVAALNRLGAVAVLMRPDGPIARECEITGCQRIVTDPEHAELVVDRTDARALVLGGGAEPRDLGPVVIDMERIDPDKVRVPAWYRPNPGRASDLAFVIFTGEGEHTRAKAITNGRWVISAFGTASSAALSPADTVYSVTPLYHPSGLLMSIGGAVAGGSRLAIATSFDPATFWSEVRRYGATIVSYTWTLLHELVQAPAHPGERGHPVRLFIGSGMPSGLWRRVTSRFAPAGVLEFYASTEGDAILVNLSGSKPGAKGRRLPGSTEVCLAAYDLEAERLVEASDGFARETLPGETGMLLACVRPDLVATSETPLRGVFEREDAWLATGDLFRRDSDGDYWMVDHLPALIHTVSGAVPGFPIQDALAALDTIDLVATYGVPTSKPGISVAVAAVTERNDVKLLGKDLNEAFAGLPHGQRPGVVRVVPEIPVTTWFRPRTGPLRAEGIPSPPTNGGAPRTFYRDASGRYRPLTATARRRLLAGN